MACLSGIGAVLGHYLDQKFETNRVAFFIFLGSVLWLHFRNLLFMYKKIQRVEPVMDWKSLQKRLRLLTLGILIILSTASVLLMSHLFAGGVLLGGLIAITKFPCSASTRFAGAFSSDGNMRKGKVSIIVKSYLRLFALGVIIYILMDKGLVDPIGLAVGGVNDPIQHRQPWLSSWQLKTKAGAGQFKNGNTIIILSLKS